MGLNANWEQFRHEIATLFKGAGFLTLASKVLSGEVFDYEVEDGLRVVLLQRRSPYLPLPAGAYSEIEYCANSFGIKHGQALKNKLIRDFASVLPEGVAMFHVHEFDQDDLEHGHVIVVQLDAYDFILEEHFTLTRND